VRVSPVFRTVLVVSALAVPGAGAKVTAIRAGGPVNGGNIR